MPGGRQKREILEAAPEMVIMVATMKSSIHPPIAAAVLAGGQSRRMGRDKSLMRLRGRSMVRLTVDKLQKAGFDPVFVVGPEKRYGLPKGLSVLGERARGKGPLSGIESALRHAQGPCLVLPCDMPWLSLAALRRLKRAYRGTKIAFKNSIFPVIFPSAALPVIQNRLASGRLTVHPLLRNATYLKGISKHQLFNMNDFEAFKIVRSDKKVP
jgi:molybdopterin-guanine dinucleotide biosynthesis protein A